MSWLSDLVSCHVLLTHLKTKVPVLDAHNKGVGQCDQI